MSDLRRSLENLLQTGGPAWQTLERGSELAIYGAGNCGRAAAACARENGMEVRAFLDAAVSCKGNCDGIPCLAPESEEAAKLARDGVPVLLAIFNFATDLRPIQQRLAEIGFKRIILHQEFHEQFGATADFWLTKREFYRGRASAILAGFDLFDDELSRRTYHDCLKFRLSLDPGVLAQPDTANQYLPADLPAPTTPIRLIDGGSFTGDSLASFADRGLEIAAVAAFEPDFENYRKLCDFAEGSRGKLGEIALLPCGLGAKSEMRNFQSGGGAGSAISEIGTSTIQILALDDVLPTFGPNFVKLDIEGWEAQALNGATKIIRRYVPRLAVCVYHAPEHLWTLPMLIHEIEPSYRLALRAHQWNGFDLVTYAYRA